MPPTYKYFTPEEVEGLNEEYVAKLDMARAKTAEIDTVKRGFPTFITSGLRSAEKNESIIGSVPNSAHLKGLAIDQAVSNWHEVFLVIASLIAVGITRIGIYVDAFGNPTHVHNDTDPDKPQQVIWIKGEGKQNSAPALA